MDNAESGARTKTYHFHAVSHCNMCGASVESARILGIRLNRSQGLNPRSKAGISVSVLRCRSCQLHFAQPMPVPADLADHYGVDPTQYWPETYFVIDETYFRRQIEDAKRLLNFKPGMKALDVGAGIGKAMRAMERAGFESWGIEPTPKFLESAAEKIGIDRARLQLASIETANFSENTFDFITFGAVLEHLTDPAGAIEKAMRWLKPNGVIQIEVPSSNHTVSWLLNLYYRVIGTNYVCNISPMHPPYHLYEFSLESFRRHGAKAGYTIAHHYMEVCTIYHLPRMLHPLLARWMAWRGTGMQLTVWLRKPG